MKLVIAGIWPAIHFRLLRELPARNASIQLAGLARSSSDLSEKAALEKAASELNVPLFPDIWQALSLGDAAVYLGPYRSRGKLLAQLIRTSGLKVLVVDKPAAITLEDLETLEKEVRGHQTPFCFPLLSLRYDARYRFVRSLCGAGLVGKVTKVKASRPHKLGQRPAWYFDRSEYPSLLADLSVHDVDMIRFITGLEVHRVTGAYEAEMQVGERSLPGLGNFGLELSEGALAEVSADWLTSPSSLYHGDSFFQVTGTLGQLKLVTDGADQGIWVESHLEGSDSILHRLLVEGGCGGGGGQWKLFRSSAHTCHISCSPTEYALDFDRMFKDLLNYLEGRSAAVETTMADLLTATRPVLEASRKASAL